MSRLQQRTLVEALAALPADADRGFRFRGLQGDDRFYSWRELELEARRRGARLLSAGLQKGDRLALVIAEPHEFVLTFLGAVVAGVVPVPMYPRASFKAKTAYVDTVAHIVESADARAVVTLDSSRAVALEILQRPTPLEKILIAEEFFALEDPASLDATSSFGWPEIRPDDLCFLQYTSGSTSLPKGVMVTHQNLIANADAFLGEAGLQIRRDDLAITWLPLFHDMGLIGFVLGTLVHDLPSVLLPTESFARRPTMWMQAMHDYRGTITFAPNFAYALAAKRTRDRDLEGLDLSAIRVAGCGAEPINPVVMRAFADRFARVGFSANALMPAYGMAEATLAISFHAHGTPMVTDRVSAEAIQKAHARPAAEGEDSLELVSCGRAFPGHEVKIVGDEGRPLGEREVGEIALRGPSVTAGYRANPAATAESYRDGWLHTGDLGYLAQDNIYVCGRIKDLIIIRGANFYPQDIEWSVAEVPGVRRDNVVAFSVMKSGEEVLVISAEANSADAPELRQAIANKIAATHGLAVDTVSLVRVGTLPKTSSGKVQRRRTKRLFEEGLLQEHPL
jgi:fatty-acyl-CoA synthase